MGSEFAFLADLTVALAAAVVGGAIASRLRLNPIIGYLLAGVVIGPFTPGYVAHSETLDTLATIGLIFLLFSLGLGFSFQEIKTLGNIALIGNIVVMVVIAGIASGGAVLAHFPHPFTIGIITAVSSTAVGAALLRAWNVENTLAGRFVLAELIVQDFVAVALLVIVTAPATSLSFAGIALPVVKALGFTAVALLLGATILARAVKQILGKVETESLFPVFGAFALVAAWLGNLAGLSFEFGAFVAGAVISEAAGSRMVISVVAPFRSLFVALFFVAVGMLLNPTALLANWQIVFVGGAIFIALRFLAWGVLSRLRRLAIGVAAFAALTMTALGEFNVVLVNEARSAHRIDAVEEQVILGVMLLSIVGSLALAPLVARFAKANAHRTVVEGSIMTPEPIVALIGFGRVGRTVGDVLRQAGVAFAAVDMSREVVSSARDAGFDAIVGDGSDPIALEHVVRPSTRVIITTLPDFAASLALLPRLRNFGVHVIARASSGGHVAELREAGADQVFVPEAEGALVFARIALQALGLDRVRIERELDAERERSPALSTERDYRLL